MMLTLIEADCLFEFPNLRRAAERFHLVYCDPPRPSAERSLSRTDG